MTSRDYTPGSAAGARIDKKGENWTLVLVRELRHPPTKVWAALTDPAQLREWAPFDSDGNLGVTGASAHLTTIGAPQPHVTETQVKRADVNKLLEFNWGTFDIRWELEPAGNGGTKLTLWHNIHRPYIAMGAAGWHVSFDVLDRFLAGAPIGRKVGPDAMKVDGFTRLIGEYANALGVEPPKWGG